MRQETQKIMSAFLRGQKASAARTNTDGRSVWLHGNKIAQRSEGDFVDFSLAGWPTVTTRDRINGLLELSGSDYRVLQKNGTQFLTNVETVREIGDSEWIRLNDEVHKNRVSV